MNDDIVRMLVYADIVILIMQLALLAMMQHVYANRNVKQMTALLHEQIERHMERLYKAILEGTEASRAAQTEANQSNLKIQHLNERLLASETKKEKKS